GAPGCFLSRRSPSLRDAPGGAPYCAGSMEIRSGLPRSMDGVRAMVVRARMVRVAALVAATACGSAYQADATPDAGGGSAANFPPNSAGAIVGPTQITIDAPCGATNDTQYIRIENGSGKAIPYEVTSPNPALVTLKDAQGASQASVAGSLAPGGIQMI